MWRYAAIDTTCREAEPAEAWLTPRERQVYGGLRRPERRCEWLAARILAKRLVGERFRRRLAPIPPARIEIDSGDGRTRRQRPQILVDGRPLDWRLSIAHSGRSLLVALIDSGRPGVGVDLLAPVDCGRGFAEMWFTPVERRWLAVEPQLWPVAWAIKEAAYKATNRGEAFRPRAFEVLPECRRRLRLRALRSSAWPAPPPFGMAHAWRRDGDACPYDSAFFADGGCHD